MAKLELFLALTISQAHVSGLSDLWSLITLCHAHTVCWLLTQRMRKLFVKFDTNLSLYEAKDMKNGLSGASDAVWFQFTFIFFVIVLSWPEKSLLTHVPLMKIDKCASSLHWECLKCLKNSHNCSEQTTMITKTKCCVLAIRGKKGFSNTSWCGRHLSPGIGAHLLCSKITINTN